MRTHLFFLLISCALIGCDAGMPQTTESCPSIIPIPSQMICHEGTWSLTDATQIEVNEESVAEGEWLAEWMSRATGKSLEILTKRSKAPGKGNIYLNVIKGDTTSEAYTIMVHPDYVWITSESSHGIFHGLQTFRQLAGAKFETTSNDPFSLQCLMIEDHPKFQHRGMLLDCCRHFMEPEFVKRYIDLLAYHKMNTLHWHLTEDQGWRIEIEKYPKLTEIGAWRTNADGSRYGGFYSREEIKDIVAYAKSRHITVIPEIELPGHSVAAIASYPHLSCRGEQIEVENEWGVFKDIYCAGNDSTFIFLKDVLTEVMDLFPSEYIHIGGDEAPKFRWENCSKCQKRMETHGLEDEHELQSWFISEIGTFLHQNGRKLIGWDEILEGGLPEGAAVQSWRGMQGGTSAALAGHEVVMSPTSHCYFDYGLDATNMNEVYAFDPIPAELPDSLHHFILGGECNMWTERAPQPTVDSKVFPRILALSEVLWSYPEERDYSAFQQRVNVHYDRLDALGVEYGFEAVPVSIETELQEDAVLVRAIPRSNDVEIRWTVQGLPDEHIDYLAPLKVSSEQHVNFISSWKGRRYDPVPFSVVFHEGLNKPFKLNHVYSPYYTGGGDSALVDGILGTNNFRDGHWQALQFGNIDIEIDLGEVQELNEIRTHFYQYNNAWIFLPQEVVIWAAVEENQWIELARLGHDVPLQEKKELIQEFAYNEQFQARWIKLEGVNIGHNPDWHDSPGEPSWLFCDEVIVR